LGRLKASAEKRLGKPLLRAFSLAISTKPRGATQSCGASSTQESEGGEAAGLAILATSKIYLASSAHALRCARHLAKGASAQVVMNGS